MCFSSVRVHLEDDSARSQSVPAISVKTVRLIRELLHVVECTGDPRWTRLAGAARVFTKEYDDEHTRVHPPTAVGGVGSSTCMREYNVCVCVCVLEREETERRHVFHSVTRRTRDTEHVKKQAIVPFTFARPGKCVCVRVRACVRCTRVNVSEHARVSPVDLRGSAEIRSTWTSAILRGRGAIATQTTRPYMGEVVSRSRDTIKVLSDSFGEISTVALRSRERGSRWLHERLISRGSSPVTLNRNILHFANY